jgi:hypothetical protein
MARFVLRLTATTCCVGFSAVQDQLCAIAPMPIDSHTATPSILGLAGSVDLISSTSAAHPDAQMRMVGLFDVAIQYPLVASCVQAQTRPRYVKSLFMRAILHQTSAKLATSFACHRDRAVQLPREWAWALVASVALVVSVPRLLASQWSAQAGLA